nr:hypothetical protein [Limnoglobus roseus]
MSITTRSPGRSAGTNGCSTYATNTSPVTAPSITTGAVIPSDRRAGTNVVVFPCPCGTSITNRGHRPCVRAIRVLAHVASTNTNLPGARCGWPARHAVRAAAPSGRSGSPARTDFFPAAARGRRGPSGTGAARTARRYSARVASGAAATAGRIASAWATRPGVGPRADQRA